jgi:hypothetical protein
MPAKATPVAGDIIPILDSAASNANSRTTVGGFKNFLLQPEASAPYRQTFTIPKTTDVAAKYAEAAAWQIETGYSDFAGQEYADPIIGIGYNIDGFLGKKDASEPGVGYFLESDYWDEAARPKAITAATRANPCVLTVTAHGFTTGQQKRITGVGGMTQLNGNLYIVTVLTADTISLNVDSTAFGTYTSGGSIAGTRTTELYCQHFVGTGKAITGATQANPCVLTVPAHGFVTGERKRIFGVAGMTQLNGNDYTVVVVGADTVQLLGVNSTGFGAYTSGGTIGFAQIRPWFFQIDRVTDRLISAHIQVPAGGALAFNESDGTTTGAGPFFAISKNAVDLYTDGSSPAIFQVRGSGTQPGVLRLGYGATNNAFAITPATAEITDIFVGASTLRAFRVQKASGANTGVKVSINSADNAGALTVDAANMENWTNIIRGKGVASPVNPMVDLRDSADVTRWAIDKDWNTELGRAGTTFAANAAAGFPYMPSSAGPPTGAPVAKTGMVPFQYDETNHRLYVRSGGTWRQVAVTP